MTTTTEKTALTSRTIDEIDQHLQAAQKLAEQAGIGGTICHQTREARYRLYGSLCPASDDLEQIHTIQNRLGILFLDRRSELSDAFIALGGLRAHPRPSLSVEDAECALTFECLLIVHGLERDRQTGPDFQSVRELFSIVGRHLHSENAIQRMRDYSAKLEQLMQQEGVQTPA